MSIRVGTRLEQLLALQARLSHEIDAERHAEAQITPNRPDGPTGRPRMIGSLGSTNEDRLILMNRLGVTSKAIRVWAADNGLEPPARGQLSYDYIEAYATAHGVSV